MIQVMMVLINISPQLTSQVTYNCRFGTAIISLKISMTIKESNRFSNQFNITIILQMQELSVLA